ncbi:hypothetical protein K7B09_12740 [Thermomonas sp. RSS23]|uniref:Uncharacterized protein n=1 Tax=Thermomonas beijingensis TaxID=2872701 RepID=A0ABS7TH44_9GAMM|nr:hypothetical protein [Thermomonas beijingensis]MBZ4187188.1 hypothetical protein [Thermomonas beijingensis]
MNELLEGGAMDVDAVIAAAKEIDRKASLQEARAMRFGELAALARKAAPGSDELRRIQSESRELSRTVIDFGGAVDALRLALRKKPRKPSNA